MVPTAPKPGMPCPGPIALYRIVTLDFRPPSAPLARPSRRSVLPSVLARYSRAWQGPSNQVYGRIGSVLRGIPRRQPATMAEEPVQGGRLPIKGGRGQLKTRNSRSRTPTPQRDSIPPSEEQGLPDAAARSHAHRRGVRRQRRSLYFCNPIRMRSRPNSNSASWSTFSR
jgi:hypothetical protein